MCDIPSLINLPNLTSHSDFLQVYGVKDPMITIEMPSNGCFRMTKMVLTMSEDLNKMKNIRCLQQVNAYKFADPQKWRKTIDFSSVNHIR